MNMATRPVHNADDLSGGDASVRQHDPHRLFLQRMPALPLGHKGRKAIARVTFQYRGELGEYEGQQPIAVERAFAVDGRQIGDRLRDIMAGPRR